MMMFEISGFHKHAMQDNYENGCDGKSNDFFIEYRIQSETIDDLKKQILSFIDAGEDSIEINACDEDGRIDITKQENDDGYTPSNAEYASFRSGEIDLWYSVYTCYVEEVSRKTAKL